MSRTIENLPCGIDELRETLNNYVELIKENDEYRKDAVKDARIISGLRHRIGELMEEIKELKK